MFEPSIVGMIPARLNSTRLPRKVLQDICGKPMIQHVYERAVTSKWLSRVIVATDSEEVQSVCKRLDIDAIMTSPDHLSGTDRIHEVNQQTRADIVVNLQGDEPMLCTSHIDALIRPFRLEPFTRVSTLKVPIDREEARNPNNVKVVCNVSGHALYFSRSMVPYDRDGNSRIQYYKHLGLYAYHRDALDLFHSLPPSRLESYEKLEQLRFLENGIQIRVSEVSEGSIGVDTEEDLQRVRMLVQAQQAA